MVYGFARVFGGVVFLSKEERDIGESRRSAAIMPSVLYDYDLLN